MITPCLHCERPMRPKRASAEEHPGTIAEQARGLCKTCHRNHRHKYPATRAGRKPKHDWPYILHELQWIANTGRPQDRAARLGVTTGQVVNAARRAGLTDMANEYTKAARDEKVWAS